MQEVQTRYCSSAELRRLATQPEESAARHSLLYSVQEPMNIQHKPETPVHRLHALPEQDLKATVEQLLSGTQSAAAPTLLAAPAPERAQGSAAAPAVQQLHLPELPPLPSASDVVRSASAAWSAASSAFSQLQRMASSPGGHAGLPRLGCSSRCKGLSCLAQSWQAAAESLPIHAVSRVGVCTGLLADLC